MGVPGMAVNGARHRPSHCVVSNYDIGKNENSSTLYHTESRVFHHTLRVNALASIDNTQQPLQLQPERRQSLRESRVTVLPLQHSHVWKNLQHEAIITIGHTDIRLSSQYIHTRIV
jgi:hypothetical protein